LQTRNWRFWSPVSHFLSGLFFSGTFLFLGTLGVRCDAFLFAVVFFFVCGSDYSYACVLGMKEMDWVGWALTAFARITFCLWSALFPFVNEYVVLKE
jgi:hypothetical protein